MIKAPGTPLRRGALDGTRLDVSQRGTAVVHPVETVQSLNRKWIKFAQWYRNASGYERTRWGTKLVAGLGVEVGVALATAGVSAGLSAANRGRKTVGALTDLKKLRKIDAPKGGGKNFDQARREGFKKAGMTDPSKVEFSKVDPKTGTVVEFKGAGGAKVGYDGPHKTPGPHHDAQHVSWQSAGKRKSGGGERGNIPYTGPQHPSRSGRK